MYLQSLRMRFLPGARSVVSACLRRDWGGTERDCEGRREEDEAPELGGFLVLKREVISERNQHKRSEM